MWSVIVDLLHISIHTPRMGSDSQSASDPKALRKYFNPRSPDGERPDTLSNFPFSSIFQSTLPGWGATRVSMWCRSCRTNFNPRSPDGERHFTACAASLRSRFQSTLPGWGATAIGFSNSSEYLFQSTLPGWGATIRGLQHFIPLEISIHAPRMGSDAAVGSVCPGFLGISIHAPRMGSDGRTRRPHPRNQLISIHAPRMGSDNASIKDVTSEYNFNPRSPDGEQPRARPASRMGHDFNPRSPDGERQSGLLVLGLAVDISIHAPRMGSNRGWDEILDQCLCISIHAPRMGSDQVRLVSRQSLKDFNPRSPDGERPRNPINTPLFVKFQSTLPGWGATSARSSFGSSQSVFQSTLPGWGATPRSACASRTPTHFNPRSPDGERPERISMSAISRDFNPRSPDGERRPRHRAHALR